MNSIASLNHLGVLPLELEAVTALKRFHDSKVPLVSTNWAIYLTVVKFRSGKSIVFKLIVGFLAAALGWIIL